jgi:hypothetical protein
VRVISSRGTGNHFSGGSVTDPVSVSPALRRFKQLVHQRRSLFKRKERSDWQSIYQVANLRQLLEQVSLEMPAGIVHDADEVQALIALANEKVEIASKKVPARTAVSRAGAMTARA